VSGSGHSLTQWRRRWLRWSRHLGHIGGECGGVGFGEKWPARWRTQTAWSKCSIQLSTSAIHRSRWGGAVIVGWADGFVASRVGVRRDGGVTRRGGLGVAVVLFGWRSGCVGVARWFDSGGVWVSLWRARAAAVRSYGVGRGGGTGDGAEMCAGTVAAATGGGGEERSVKRWSNNNWVGWVGLGWAGMGGEAVLGS
jgi:hypothetical protein